MVNGATDKQMVATCAFQGLLCKDIHGHRRFRPFILCYPNVGEPNGQEHVKMELLQCSGSPLNPKP